MKLSNSTQAALHKVILTMRQPLTQNQQDALHDGSLHIKTSKFAGHHLFKGGRSIVQFADALKSDLGIVQANFAQVPSQPCSFRCPRDHHRPSDSQFDCYNLSKSIWCASCKGCHAATAWRCPCNLPWHKCAVHFVFPLMLYSANRVVQRAARSAQRLLVLTLLHELYAAWSRASLIVHVSAHGWPLGFPTWLVGPAALTTNTYMAGLTQG